MGRKLTHLTVRHRRLSHWWNCSLQNRTIFCLPLFCIIRQATRVTRIAVCYEPIPASIAPPLILFKESLHLHWNPFFKHENRQEMQGHEVWRTIVNLIEFLLKISRQSLLFLCMYVQLTQHHLTLIWAEQGNRSVLFVLRLFQVIPYARDLKGICPSGIRAEGESRGQFPEAAGKVSICPCEILQVFLNKRFPRRKKLNTTTYFSSKKENKISARRVLPTFSYWENGVKLFPSILEYLFSDSWKMLWIESTHTITLLLLILSVHY